MRLQINLLNKCPLISVIRVNVYSVQSLISTETLNMHKTNRNEKESLCHIFIPSFSSSFLKKFKRHPCKSNCVIQFYSVKHSNFSAQRATSYFYLLFTSLAEKRLLEYCLRQFVYIRRINLCRRDELLKRFTISELDYVASTRGKETIRWWISDVSFPPFPDV